MKQTTLLRRSICMLLTLSLLLALVPQLNWTVSASAAEPFYVPDETVNIIFDTDLDSDVDDAGAMGLLHSYVQEGKVNLLATIGCCRSGFAAPAMSAYNHYYGAGDVVVGVNTASPANYGSKYQSTIARFYYNTVGHDYYALTALQAYRQVLSEAKDNSVVIVVAGTISNIYALMLSPADEISELTGMELVAKKVKLLSIMAGAYPSGLENNMRFDAAASIYVAEKSPVPVLWADLGATSGVTT